MPPELKQTYDSKTDIPSGYEGLYKEADGKWTFTGGAVPEDQTSKVTEFRESNIQLRRELEGVTKSLEETKKAYEGIDPERFKKAQEQLAKIEAEEERNLIQEGNFDAVVDRRFAERLAVTDQAIKTKDEALSTRDKTISKLKTELGRRQITGEVDAIIEAKKLSVTAGARRDLHSRTLERFEINDDGERVTKAGVLDSDGNAMTLEQHVDDLVDNAKHLFVASKGGGATGGDETARVSEGDTLVRPDAMVFGKNLEKIAKGEIEVDIRGPAPSAAD